MSPILNTREARPAEATAEGGTAIAYVGGKVHTVTAGSRAGEFVPQDGNQYDLVVTGTDEDDIRVVDAGYRLQANEKLVLTPRGQAG